MYYKTTSIKLNLFSFLMPMMSTVIMKVNGPAIFYYNTHPPPPQKKKRIVEIGALLIKLIRWSYTIESGIIIIGTGLYQIISTNRALFSHHFINWTEKEKRLLLLRHLTLSSLQPNFSGDPKIKLFVKHRSCSIISTIHPTKYVCMSFSYSISSHLHFSFNNSMYYN